VHTDYIKYISNLKLYNSANIPRIDTHIINLIREHYLQASKILINSLIHYASYPNPLYHEMTLNSDFIPPEAFLYLNQMVQDDIDVSIIYHYSRYNNNKKLEYSKHAIQAAIQQ